MSLQAAFIRWLAIQVNEEIQKRDAEIEKLKTALAGAQEENRGLWKTIEDKHMPLVVRATQPIDESNEHSAVEVPAAPNTLVEVRVVKLKAV